VDDKVTRAFFMARAHEMACKLVKWVGDEFRLVIGQIFSGIYPTSWLGTTYLTLVRYYIELEIYYDIKKENPTLAEEWKKSFRPGAQYGDDTLIGYEKKYFKWVVGEVTKEFPLGLHQKRLLQYFGLVIKLDPMPEIFGMGAPYSTEPIDGGSPFITRINTLRTPHGAYKNVVLYQGPVFLKRSFVMLHRTSKPGTSEILPWRPEGDSYDRAAISTTDLGLNLKKMLSKYQGLMIDSCGTNYVAYSFCRSMFRMIRPQVSDIEKDDTERRYMLKMGFSSLPDDVLFNPNRLLHEFCWDEDWRRSWAFYGDYKLYDDFGKKRELRGTIVPEYALDSVGEEWEYNRDHLSWADM